MAKRIFDKEVESILSGMMPFGAGTTHEFCVVAEDSPVPEDLRPVVTVRAFNRTERRQAFDLLKRFKGLTADEIEKAHELARGCVSGWRNVWDLSTGEEVEYSGAKTGVGADVDKWFDMAQLFRSQVFMHLCRISGIYDFHALGLSY